MLPLLILDVLVLLIFLVIHVVVLCEIVVGIRIDSDIVVPPATPPAAIATPRRTHSHSCGKGKRSCCCDITGRIDGVWWISRIRPDPIDNSRIVRGDIHHLGGRGLNDDHLRLFFDDDLLLLRGLQIPRFIGLATKTLN
jgi:hypothetical protein